MVDLWISFQLLTYALSFFFDDMNYKVDHNQTLATTGDKHRRSGFLDLPRSSLPQDATVIVSDSLPENKDYMPEIGNGHIATVIQSDSIFMNGLYNGANYTSHRARIPSTVGFAISHTTPSSGLKQTFTLDLGRGLFTETYTGNGVSISLRSYAHRVYTSVIVSELILVRDDASTDVRVTISANHGAESNDMDFYNDTLGLIRGVTRIAEYPEIASQTQFYMKTSASLKGNHSISNGQLSETIAAFTAIGVDKQKVLDDYDKAVQAFKDSSLLSLHVNEWETAWNKGRIDVEGDLNIAKINYGALYYLYSSLPFNGNSKTWPFIGLSPGGLAHGDNGNSYAGHVFWDQDIWMFPGLALLNAEFGRLMVETRTKTLDTAKKLATETGWRGARYPWESAFTGLETCPGSVYRKYEIHINGDVAMMMRHYWQLTGDSSFFLNERGYEVVQELGVYFASRVTYDSTDDTYRIQGVMPPDEYYYPVNDSIYTNNIAAATFNFSNSLSSALGRAENVLWSEIAKKLLILYDTTYDYNPEFDGYIRGDWTKQADVVMVTYPLMIDVKTSTKINNLNYYETTTPVGPAPAMTWSIFLINWLELGNETKAAELFQRSILNVQKPFYIWSENSDGSGATNFLTGMGGHLQAILFGYGGCRIYYDHLFFDPKMIPGTTKVTFTNIDYMNNEFDMYYNEITLSITLTSTQSDHGGLEIKLSEIGTWEKLQVGQEVRVHRQSFRLRKIS